MRRYAWLREIRRLDPERDFLRIYRIIATHEFPWDITRALEPALYRTLGRHMAIAGLPQTYQDFERHLDAYEEAHFGFDEGARRVPDATLDLIKGYPKGFRVAELGTFPTSHRDNCPGPQGDGPAASRAAEALGFFAR
ncbi:hypothetical protein [Streptomyces lydicus]|uniref:hypothetical protein n=1 Tax=Streptomyces lydicus TaxID=47763 RepID=UPI00101315DB|nr:hypothetical protein [Streptomyces lydicus]MCZ1006052.1 hypothetical protein [Streptomyces lydicus]